MHIRLIILFLCMACSGQRSEGLQEKVPVVISLLGVSFYEPERTTAQQARLDSNLLVAKKNFEADPSEENYIWYGRREGYLMHLDKAIAIYSEGITKYPKSHRLYRHRGHRYITVRKFDLALADLEKAAALMEGRPIEIEPDGQPNKLDQPLTTTQFNVWYHLGLAFYLEANFPKAEAAFLKCLAVSKNDDSRIAVLDWLYMTYRRKGKNEEATKLLGQVTDSMTVIENDSYYTRLKMYKGWLKPNQVLQADSALEDYDLSLATQGYGVGNWYYYNGDTAKARETFEKVVSGKLFAAFGFVAAEAELARMR